MENEVDHIPSSKSLLNSFPARKFIKKDIKRIKKKEVSFKNHSDLKSDDYNSKIKHVRTSGKAENYIYKEILKDMEMSIQSNDLKLEDVSFTKKKLNKGCVGIIPKKKSSFPLFDKSKNFIIASNIIENPKKYKIKKIKKNKKKKLIKTQEKNRILLRSHILYDSFDEESEKHKIGFFISPNSTPMLIFDSLIYIYSSIYVIYIPFRIAKMKCFCDEFNSKNFNSYFIKISDIINTFDIIISFFKGYYNFKFQMITNSQRIISHYLKTLFIFDFIQCIPEFVIINQICNNKSQIYSCVKYEINYFYFFTIFLLFFKSTKVLKTIRKKQNSLIRKIKTFLIDYTKLTEIFGCYQFIFVIISMIHCVICLHIFIGNYNYPNWIINSNSQNGTFLDLYIHSIYTLFTTLTTVGYGDTPPASLAEIILQIFLLTAGVVAYSFLITTISNYVKKETRATIRREQDKNLLKEFAEEYKIPNKLFNKIHLHLKTKTKAFQKCDKNILINSLPFSLRNQVLLAIYDDVKTNFKFFNKCQNNDFIIRTISSFIPFMSKKNAVLIEEGQVIENIIFVNQGSLSLEATINKDKILESASKYLMINFEDIIDNNFGNDESSISKCENISMDIERYRYKLGKIVDGKYSSQLLNESKIEEELGKCDYGENEQKSNFSEDNNKFLKILNIYKNESFGIIYVFLNKQSPLTLRVKSRKAELFLLRKYDAFSISMLYPNIWKNIQRKSYKNICSIKKKTIKIIETYCISNGIYLSNIIHFNKKNLYNKNLNSSSNCENFGSLSNYKSSVSKNNNSYKNIKKSVKISNFDYSNKNNIKSDIDHYNTNEINQKEINNDDENDNNKENDSNNKDYNKENEDDKKNEKNETQKKLTLTRQICISSKNVVKHSTIADIRIAYLKKLKAEIDFNEREKNKFKQLYEQLTQAINKKFSNKNKKMTYENFIEIKKQVEINNEVYKDDNESNIEQEFIKVNIENFSINSIYNNLNVLTAGEYTNNKNLRKRVSKVVLNNLNSCNNRRVIKRNSAFLENSYKNILNSENFVNNKRQSFIIKSNELMR